MAFRFFEESAHVAAYLQYRVTPHELINKIIDFMGPKLQNKFNLAVDVGCGNGKGTVLLAPYFNQVVGTDVSPAQLGLARANSIRQNVSYRQSPAEQLPFESSQVDLVTATTAAHWFDRPRFLKEAERVLKPNGCLALLGNMMDRALEYGDATSAVNNICQEVIFILTFTPWYISHGTNISCGPLLFHVCILISKLLAAMQVSSPDTELTMVIKYFYMLARKP
uniref:Si:ch211-93g23.2 n=1 Tax=Hippocampus comes TaxID=109280 RepID=A0A3Q3DWG2_HIPCM